MLKPTVLCTLLTICAGCWSFASAARVEGVGTIATNLPGPFLQIDTEYEHPAFLDVGKIVQLTASDLNGAGLVALSYFGEAQFGRLGVSSHVGGPHQNLPDLSTGVDFYLGFEDEITPQNLNPLTPNFLRLDIALSGLMLKSAPDTPTHIGGSASAIFEINMISVDSGDVLGGASVTFTWFGDSFFITYETGSSGATPAFVPYPGEEAHFTQNTTPGPPRYFFGARGYVDLPLYEEDGSGFIFSTSYLLQAYASAHVGCEVVQCAVETNFGNTALIGNARIVDANGNPVPGGSFSAQSGYDYITPPGPLGSAAAVPEPASMLLAGSSLAAVLLRRRYLRPG